MDDIVIPQVFPPKKNNKRVWWGVGIVGGLAYLALMFWLLFYSVYAANISFVTPLRNWYQLSVFNFFPLDWQKEIKTNDIAANCKGVLSEDVKEYNTRLFTALGNDVAWSEQGRFTSPTHKTFAVFPISPPNQTLSPTFVQTPCWVIAVYDTGTTGRIVYETRTGVIHFFKVKNLPMLSR